MKRRAILCIVIICLSLSGCDYNPPHDLRKYDLPNVGTDRSTAIYLGKIAEQLEVLNKQLEEMRAGL